MVTSQGVPVQSATDRERLIETPEMIDRMAAELRARSDTDLPHSFYVQQIRRQLAGEARAGERTAANDSGKGANRTGQLHPSVFHAWALSE
ncbi:hypothetical protein [Rhizobium sp. SSA_523]|uniref:hypothetical protein n=1 Tax=Rhizobium sp. SSA_523 TaxID=2952477 RepID=UPI002090792F|nr:hypothetical protein [Rhizobium sp. SSA_523]MCO5730432.1 hypothetical protein [Rhizobium sp. SSA_523]WKC25475.1 hypothetical protein QTJ18_16055 [Rhizobium sp. SSA_523]